MTLIDLSDLILHHMCKSNTTNNTYTYDAKLDHLNQSASSQNNSTRSNTYFEMTLIDLSDLILHHMCMYY
jgi:hypothetical protein